MAQSIEQLLEQARAVRMTAEEIDAQRRSFAWGNANIENERITKEMVDEAAAAMDARPAGDGK